MNENIQENYATVEENVNSNSGVSDNNADSSWVGGSSISAGNSEQTEPAYVSGNGNTINLPETCDSVSGNSSYTGTSANVESNMQLLAQISQGIDTLNSTVTLLFFFLLMAWAEKKINVVVRRFSEKR